MPCARYYRDPSVTKQRIKPGTVRRIMSYARPYRRDLALFLGMNALAAVAAVAVPLLLKTLIDQGILAGNEGVVIAVAAVVAGLALVSALLSFAQRWYSARIGEGLIYDLRTEVFSHVQRQPIAFFTRAQTGSLVSRLNSDVIGAQQAITSTLSLDRVQRADPDPGADRHVQPVLAGVGGHAGDDPGVRDPGPAGRPGGCSG